MALPSGWIPNSPAPETLADPYTGDPTSTWIGGPEGPQPNTAANPAGTIGSIPVMSITAAIAEKLSGAQEE